MRSRFRYLMASLLLAAALWSSCGRHNAVPAPAAPAPSTMVAHDTTPQILFLFLKISRDTTVQAGATIALTHTQLAPGKLKIPVKMPRVAQPDELLCAFLDAQGREISAQVVEDALTASTEYPEEDGTMQRAYLYKDEAELFLRVPYSPRLSLLRVSKVMPDGKLVLMGEVGLTF